jgi:hypothetical protein
MRSLFFFGAAASFAIAACESDPTSNPTPDAGLDSGTSGFVDASVDTGSDAVSLTDAGLEAEAEASAPDPVALFVGTNFVKAELSAVSVGASPKVLGRLALDDQDSVPYVSRGRAFVLSRAKGKLVVLDPKNPHVAERTIDINDSPEAGAYSSNPRTAIVSTGNKAYVARYASNTVKIVDLAAGTASGSIDLAPAMAAADPDGFVDVEDGVYEPSSKRVYFLLQRIDQFDFSGTAPDFVSRCLAHHGMIVAVDTTSDQLVDLNGAATGVGIELLGNNPGTLILDKDRLIVSDTGCYVDADGGTAREGRGIEAIALGTGTPSWLYQTTSLDRLGGILWLDATHAYVRKGSRWYEWNPTQTTLGNEVSLPLAPVFDGTRILGLKAVAADAGDAGTAWSVVSGSTTLVTNPFQSVDPDPFYGVAGAIFRP